MGKKIKQENESHEQKSAEIDKLLAKEAGQAVVRAAVVGDGPVMVTLATEMRQLH